MMIHEHKAGSHVKVYQPLKLNEFLETEILDPVDKDPTYHCVCESIQKDGKYINICAPGLIAEVTDVDTGRCYKYPVYKCGHISWKGIVYFAIMSRDDISPHNRRSEFRIEMFTSGDVQIRTNTKVRPCYIRDISQSGLGFTILKEYVNEIAVGDYVSVSFTAKHDNQIRHVNGVIVRIVESANREDVYVVGVKLCSQSLNMKWFGLVAMEQRIKLQERKLDKV